MYEKWLHLSKHIKTLKYSRKKYLNIYEKNDNHIHMYEKRLLYPPITLFAGLHSVIDQLAVLWHASGLQY